MRFLHLLLVLLTSYINALPADKFKSSEVDIFERCYSDTYSQQNPYVNGQQLPIPSSMEAFIALVEKIELSTTPPISPTNLIRKLLLNFGIEKDTERGGMIETFLKLLFNMAISPPILNKDEVSDDEKCALYMMLAHRINNTARTNEERVDDFNTAKYPREYGIVSLNGNTRRSVALAKVLLGIMAGMETSNEVNANELCGRLPGENNIPKDINVDRLYAATLGDIVFTLIKDFLSIAKNEYSFANGIWDDAVCTSTYYLQEKRERYVTKSLIRGAIDGYVLGKKFQSNTELRQLPLSQILRMYYSSSGYPDKDIELTWCNRRALFDMYKTEFELKSEKSDPLFRCAMKYKGDKYEKDKAIRVQDFISRQGDIFAEIEDDHSDCSPPNVARNCEWTSHIFALLDFGPQDKKDLQLQVIGNLSVTTDMRPSGSSMGVYTNLRPTSGEELHTITNGTVISGCPSCFAKYFSTNQIGRPENEGEVMKDLNLTLGAYNKHYNEQEESSLLVPTVTPSSVVLYFSFGNVAGDWTLRTNVINARDEIRRNFREVTILGIGSNKASLEYFTHNTDEDIFINIGNAKNLVDKLKTRICKVPAELRFLDCNRGSRSEGKFEGFITPGKIQYWAMYPKYFLKSYNIVLKFSVLNGGQIKVCFSRYYHEITDKGKSIECKDFTGTDIEFYVSNPCHRYNEHNCDPFYFKIEGKNSPTTLCKDIRCKTSNQIHFELFHQGISCNKATLVSISTLTVILAILASVFAHKH